jgi:hypothetical protein
MEVGALKRDDTLQILACKVSAAAEEVRLGQLTFVTGKHP